MVPPDAARRRNMNWTSGLREGEVATAATTVDQYSEVFSQHLAPPRKSFMN
jgi:hypothetical protein